MSSLPIRFAYSVTELYKGEPVQGLSEQVYDVHEMADQGFVDYAFRALEAMDEDVRVVRARTCDNWSYEFRAHRILPLLGA